MNRFLGALAVFALIGAAFAQAPFTIVSPRNYNPDTNLPLSREKVVLKFPKGSMPKDSYIGIYMGATRGDRVENEQFMEATTPDLQGSYYVYTLDTKARQIPDGMYTIRAVLYVDYTDRPREIQSTQVNVRIANQSSIKIPTGGLSLHYAFRPGQEWVYRVESRSAVSTISGSNNLTGGIPAQLPLESETIRMMYAIDNTYGDGGAMVRLQALPLKGKDYVYVTPEGSDEPAKFYTYEMAPIYMRVNNTGREIFGAIPRAYGTSDFVPLAASGGEREELYANYPLPALPSKLVKPGDSWQTVFFDGATNYLDNKEGREHFVRKLVGRGEFLGVEYEHGHPCARIHNTIALGAGSPAAGQAISDDKRGVDETILFALDIRKIIKIVRTTTIETKVQNGGSGFQTGGGGGANNGSPKGPAGVAGAAGGGGGGSSRAGNWHGSLNQRGGAGAPGAPGVPGGPPGVAGRGGGPSGMGNGGFPGPGRGANAPNASAQYFRYTYQEIFTLEE